MGSIEETKTTVQESEAKKEDRAIEVLRKYIDRECLPGLIAEFVIAELAATGGPLAEQIRSILRTCVGPYVDRVGWEDSVQEDSEVILEVHKLLDVWRRHGGQAQKKESAPDGPKEPADEPAISPAEHTQKIVREWLLDRDFASKLAVVLLGEYCLSDHKTADFAYGIIDRFKADVLAAVKSPEAVGPQEMLLVGVACEAMLSSELM